MANEPDIDIYKRITSKNEAPEKSFLFYNIMGGIGYVDSEHIKTFYKYYVKADSFPKTHTMDLSFAKFHSLILDIDFKGRFSSSDISEYMNTHLKPTLKSTFDEIDCFSYISATRGSGSGLHIHLPEFRITFDDFVHFCSQLQQQLNVTYENFKVVLDIPVNFCLATASKPGQESYKPFNLCYVENNTDICVPLSDKYAYTQKLKQIKFKAKKSNANSFFRKLIYFSYDQLMTEVINCMQPFVIFPGIEIKQISYQTIIAEESVNNFQPICTVFCTKNTYHIYKSNTLNFKSLDWLSVWNFLNNNSFKITKINTWNKAISLWFERVKSSISTDNDIFQNVNEAIKEQVFYWRAETHPLFRIMEYDRGRYFLPIFYSLIKVIDNKSPHEILDNLTGKLDQLDVLINRSKAINENIFNYVSEYFSIETILYCASNMRVQADLDSFSLRIDHILDEMKQTILQCKTHLQLEAVIENVVNRFTPIIIGIYKHSVKKPVKLLWNVISEYWQEVSNEDVKHHIYTICKRLEKFLHKNKTGLDAFKKIQVIDIIHVVQGVANMQRKTLQMDSHKYLIKTRAGILDLLTGHVSVNVPEFFMSSVCIDVNFTRTELINFRNDPNLLHIYEIIRTKRFFRAFLKKLLLNKEPFANYVDILKTVAEEFGMEKNYKYIESIFHFYCHLCKWTSFEYEMVIYLLYVISSLFIATNYYRRFFMFQGITKNGKSKFFEMFTKIFGSYGFSIRSLHLKNSKNKPGPEPELSGTLHSCRIITVEELSGKINENFIKELTGNSNFSCRTLFDLTSGGIPTAKVFASTNAPPVCIASDAFRDRVLAIPFSAYFTENAPNNASEQIQKSEYLIDQSDAIVYNSCDGMFLLSYCNLFQNVDYNSGLLYLPKTPEIMLEFKHQYLHMTNIYAQFKQHVDLQIIEGSKVLQSDLITAVRQFLRQTKSNANLENTILKSFDKEFNCYKKENDSGLYNCFFNSTPDSEDEEPFEKQKKILVIYYENVNIKKIRSK